MDKAYLFNRLVLWAAPAYPCLRNVINPRAGYVAQTSEETA